MASETKETAPAKGQEIRKAAPARALAPFEEMDRLFERFFRHGGMRPWRFEWPSFPELGRPLEGLTPKVDVIDREAEVIVRAEVPGVEKKDLDVSVSDDTVTIKGEVHREEKAEQGDYHRHEISMGAFARTVALPAEVDGTKAKAVFKDGILEVTLPKREQARRHSIKLE